MAARASLVPSDMRATVWSRFVALHAERAKLEQSIGLLRAALVAAEQASAPGMYAWVALKEKRREERESERERERERGERERRERDR